MFAKVGDGGGHCVRICSCLVSLTQGLRDSPFLLEFLTLKNMAVLVFLQFYCLLKLAYFCIVSHFAQMLQSLLVSFHLIGPSEGFGGLSLER